MKQSQPVSLQPDTAMAAYGDGLSASEIAQAVRGRKMSAASVTEAALLRITKHDPILNAFTDVTADRWTAKGRAADAAVMAGQNVGPRGRIGDQRRPSTAAARRHADRADGGGRRRPGWRAQYG